jgi:hypothetical protein
VLRTAAGKHRVGSTYVPKFGPKFRNAFVRIRSAKARLCIAGAKRKHNASARKQSERHENPMMFMYLQPNLSIRMTAAKQAGTPTAETISDCRNISAIVEPWKIFERM